MTVFDRDFTVAGFLGWLFYTLSPFHLSPAERERFTVYRFCPDCGKKFQLNPVSVSGLRRHQCDCGVVSWHPCGWMTAENYDPPIFKGTGDD